LGFKFAKFQLHLKNKLLFTVTCCIASEMVELYVTNVASVMCRDVCPTVMFVRAKAKIVPSEAAT